jgi:hypothetical protein
MERRKTNGNYSPPKNNLIQDLEGNEEWSPVLDSKKAKINDTKEPNDAHKNILKEEILK